MKHPNLFPVAMVAASVAALLLTAGVHASPPPALADGNGACAYPVPETAPGGEDAGW